MSKRIILLSAALVILIVGGVPLLVMLAKSLTADGRFSFRSYRDLINPNAHHWTLLKNSIVLASSTSLIATIIGLPLGIVLGKTDLPLRRLLAALFAIPLLIPPYIVAISWFHLLGKEGVVGSALPPVLADSLSAGLFGLPGCIWVLSSVFAPIVMLLTMVYLEAINPRLEEAGRLVGGWPTVLKNITLPLIRPGVAFAAILVFLFALGEVGVPAFLRYPVFPLETLTQFSAFYNFGAATATATPLVMIAFLLLLAERHFLQEDSFHLYTAAKTAASIDLGRWRIAMLAWVGTLCFITAVAPLMVLAWKSPPVTWRLGPASGTRSNIACSRISR
jgi:iron(III) transport system permease protein